MAKAPLTANFRHSLQRVSVNERFTVRLLTTRVQAGTRATDAPIHGKKGAAQYPAPQVLIFLEEFNETGCNDTGFGAANGMGCLNRPDTAMGFGRADESRENVGGALHGQ